VTGVQTCALPISQLLRGEGFSQPPAGMGYAKAEKAEGGEKQAGLEM